MTDRELLELAAKAAGLNRLDTHDCAIVIEDCDGYSSVWNPLVSERDALELFADLRMGLSFTGRYVRARIYHQGKPFVSVREKIDGRNYPSRYAATRRAIVRAAAEIGKAKQ